MLCIKVEKKTKLERLICLGASPAPQVVIFHVKFAGAQSNGVQSSRGKFPGGGSHPRGQSSGGQCIEDNIPGAIFRVVIFQGEIFFGSNYPGDNFTGGNFPVTSWTGVSLVLMV